MAVDVPARIAVLGAGPVGLEAALYARFLGYEVHIFEQDEIAGSVQRWGHVRMFSPFGMNRSTLGVAAIEAQDSTYSAPSDDALLTGQEWMDRYLIPLSQTDLLTANQHTRTKVISVARRGSLKCEMPGGEERSDSPFRILLQKSEGTEWESEADVVLDTTGVYHNANWAGQGGAPAIGERASRPKIEYHVPDVMGANRGDYENRSTLVVGSGYSAATSIVELARLKESSPETEITWLTRNDARAPIKAIENDRLPERARLTETANRLAGSIVKHWPGSSVRAIRPKGSRDAFEVEVDGAHAGTHSFDRIIANVGYRPDNSIYEELQVHECYATGGPVKLAAALLAETGGDCLNQSTHGPKTLLNPEPDFYILGSKSYGRNSNFLMSLGLDQIREVFTMIGDRTDLDLYAGATKLPK